MRTTTRMLAPVLILVLAITVVAVPTAALAQSAGDEQYVDPFQDPGGGGNGNSQGDGGGGGGGGGGDGDAPADDQVAQAPADTGDTAGTTAAETGDQGTLPTTGLAIGGVALAGALLLGGGIALRRLWAPPS
jgi:hypothetical protein